MVSVSDCGEEYSSHSWAWSSDGLHVCTWCGLVNLEVMRMAAEIAAEIRRSERSAGR
jgi:hypothetical protein